MGQNMYIFAAAVTFGISAGPAVFAEAEATQILEEYLAFFDTDSMVVSIGDKQDESKFTQWNTIQIRSKDGAGVFVIPWLRVSKRFLGGHEMTIAPRIAGQMLLSDPTLPNVLNFAIESQDFSVNISGQAGARDYSSSFKDITFSTVDTQNINITAKITEGRGRRIMKDGSNSHMTGDYKVENIAIDYDLNIDGQSLAYKNTVKDVSVAFELPFYEAFDADNPTQSFDPTRNLMFQYETGAGATEIKTLSPSGPVDVMGSYASGSGEFGIVDTVATLSGISQDMSYTVSVGATGLPPMDASISEMSMAAGFPLDNVTESKPSDFKIALKDLELSNGVWAAFDPEGVLPKDAINLDIDLSADIRWLQKIAEINLDAPSQTPPIQVDRAEIKALNLKALGAEMQTTGSVVLDNSQFPPAPEGAFNISLKGAEGLIENLASIGLLPKEQLLVVRGMKGVFFKSGGDDEDHLISKIELTKEGRVWANGVPVK